MFWAKSNKSLYRQCNAVIEINAWWYKRVAQLPHSEKVLGSFPQMNLVLLSQNTSNVNASKSNAGWFTCDTRLSIGVSVLICLSIIALG